jgi:hypothetical protein
MQPYNMDFTAYFIVLTISVQLAIVVTDVYTLQSTTTITQYCILPGHSQKLLLPFGNVSIEWLLSAKPPTFFSSVSFVILRHSAISLHGVQFHS